MTVTQHHHAEHLAAIAGHLDNTPEALATNQRAGTPYTAEDGCYIRRMYHDNNHHGGITFSYHILAYDHTTDISVEVKLNGIETGIMVPGDTPADAIAHAAMSALRATIDVITITAHVERIQA